VETSKALSLEWLDPLLNPYHAETGVLAPVELQCRKYTQCPERPQCPRRRPIS
jgi:hypothetical protein